MNKEDAQKYLYAAMATGEAILENGGEVSRVEDSIRRICTAYGLPRADVFCITSSIVTTVYFNRDDSCTQTRRITHTENDFDRLGRVNALSRQICEEHTDPEVPLTLDKKGVKRLLEDSGVGKEKLGQFDRHFDESFHRDDYPLLASNIANTSRFELKTPDVRVIVNPERADLVETRMIDGKKCLVIRIEDRVEVNGIEVHSV